MSPTLPSQLPAGGGFARDRARPGEWRYATCARGVLTAMRRLLLPLLLPFALAAAPAAHAADPPWEKADRAISCSDTVGSSPFYQGASASTEYDQTFALGHAIPKPMLDGYIPQGLGTWPNWGGAGKDLLIQVGYNKSSDYAAIVGMVPGGGSTAMAQLAGPGNAGLVKTHAGGVAVAGKWLYVSGPTSGDTPSVLRYRLKAVRKALANGTTLKAQAQQPINVGSAGFRASFISAEGNTLWIGTHNKDHRNRMHRFIVSPKGGLTRVGGWVQIPKKTQGLAVTKRYFIYSTSYLRTNRSNVYVVRRGKKFLDNAKLRCFAAPSMSQGITLSGGQVFLSFESGSYYYDDQCDKGIFEGRCTRNVITHLHRASRKALVGS